MSLILEALRKSEAERRRGQAPDVLADMPAPRSIRRWPVAAWLPWLLAATLLLLMGLAMRNRAPAPPPAPPSAAAATDHPDALPAPRRASLPPVPRLLPQPDAGHRAKAPTPAAKPAAPAPADASGPVETATVAPAERPSAGTPARASAAPPAPLPAPAAAPPIADAAAEPGRTESLADLSTAERQSLPPLRLSMHLWNPDPARRFVILDGRRVVEGDRVGDAVVHAITTAGVVLDWHGRRLLLPIR